MKVQKNKKGAATAKKLNVNEAKSSKNETKKFIIKIDANRKPNEEVQKEEKQKVEKRKVEKLAKAKSVETNDGSPAKPKKKMKLEPEVLSELGQTSKYFIRILISFKS